MKRADRKLLDRMVSALLAKTDEAQAIHLFADLQEELGRGAAEYWLVLRRGYKAKKKVDPAAVRRDCETILKHYQRDDRMLWPAKVCLISFVAMFAVIVGLIGFSLAGRRLVSEDHGLVGLLMALLAGVTTFTGFSTATVNALLPASSGAKISIKIAGTAAGVAGTAILMHTIGY